VIISHLRDLISTIPDKCILRHHARAFVRNLPQVADFQGL